MRKKEFFLRMIRVIIRNRKKIAEKQLSCVYISSDIAVTKGYRRK